MSVITLNVDEVRRTLSASDTNAFVINDKNVDIVRFALLTGFTDIALDEHSALRVMYQRPGETQVRAQTLTYYDTDGIRNYYDWELLAADLAKSGTLTVALCILRTDGDVEEWHTTPCQIRVLGSIHTDDSDEGDESITPTVAQRVAVLETMIQRIASGAPIVVGSVSEMTDTDQIYVLSTDGCWYYYDGTTWVIGGEYGAVTIDTTLTQAGIPADAKAVGDAIGVVDEGLNQLDEHLDQLNEVVNGTSEQNYVDGKNIAVDGSILDATDFCVSDFVPITWLGYAMYFCNDSTVQYKYVIAFYDANKTYIQQFKNPATVGDAEYRGINHETQVTQGTPAFVRFSFKSGTVGKIMNYSRTETLWESEITVGGGVVSDIGNLSNLNTENKDNLVGAINEVFGKIPDAISPEDTTFFIRNINLCDPATCVDGEFVNQTTGAFVTNSLHQRTDYIPVGSNNAYFVVLADNVARDTRYAFYKSDKTFISGGLILGSGGLQTFTSPANAAYMIASVGTTAYDIMVAQTDEVVPFEPYMLYIDSRYVNMGRTAKLNLPAKIYAVVGFELNIYFENITEDWTKYDWDIICSVGRQMERGYQITPVAADVGTKTLTIKATDEYGNISTVVTSLVITAATAGSGQSKSIIVLGDSTTNNGTVIEKLNTNFSSDVMNVTTLGTRGTAPNNHEGRSGWKMSDYFTVESIDYTDGRGHVANPFYNPSTQTFDASYYFVNSEIAVPDFFIINMGVNDVFNFTSDTALNSSINQFISYVDDAIASIKAAAPNTKICICCTIPPNHSQDAFGKAYSCNQTRNRCKRNNTLLVDRIIEEYDGRESENIYVIPIHTNLDTVYNMGMETLPVNYRNTDTTYQSPISNGGVHPVASGYWQIADVYTAFLKAQA